MGNVGAGGFLALNPMEPPHLIQDLNNNNNNEASTLDKCTLPFDKLNMTNIS